MSNQLWNVGQLFFILGDFLMFGPCLKVRFDVEALYLQFISFSSLIDPLKTKPYLDIFGDWPIDPIGSPRYNWRSSSAYLEATRFANRVLWRRMTLWHVCTSTLKLFSRCSLGSLVVWTSTGWKIGIFTHRSRCLILKHGNWLDDELFLNSFPQRTWIHISMYLYSVMFFNSHWLKILPNRP